MRCPRCRTDDTKVIDSREAEEGTSIRRRRLCASCQHRFTTYERLEEVPLIVVKSHGSREPFDRSKIEQLSIELEDHSRLQGNEITSAELGVEVLERLRSLDDVTYLRFASVYKNFDAAADFQRELVLLKKLQSS